MLILLPPSESKRPGGGSAVSALSFEDELGAARRQVRSALESLSADPEDAARILKLGKTSSAEVLFNQQLASSPVLPAAERYDGVLFDALEPETLDVEARRWLDQNAAVQSALFGLIRAGDTIPRYRLSAGSRLPGLGSSLKRFWARAHDAIHWHERGFILDLRSKDYAACAPLPDGVGLDVHVVQEGPDGVTRALNHFNKAAKGDLVRRLATSGPRLESAEDLRDWGASQGIDIGPDHERPGRVILRTTIGVPSA